MERKWGKESREKKADDASEKVCNTELYMMKMFRMGLRYTFTLSRRVEQKHNSQDQVNRVYGALSSITQSKVWKLP